MCPGRPYANTYLNQTGLKSNLEDLSHRKVHKNVSVPLRQPPCVLLYYNICALMMHSSSWHCRKEKKKIITSDHWSLNWFKSYQRRGKVILQSLLVGEKRERIRPSGVHRASVGWSDFEILAIIMSTHCWLGGEEPFVEEYPAVTQLKDGDRFVHTTDRWKGKEKRSSPCTHAKDVHCVHLWLCIALRLRCWGAIMRTTAGWCWLV